jgi:cytochrome c
MRISAFAGVVALIVTAACGGGEQPPPASPTAPNAPAPSTFAEQVTAGQTLYGANCASCHGNSGEGVNAPRVVGLDKGALPLDPPADRKFRKTPFKTAADVAAFVVKNMPPGKGGSLTEDQYYSILAFDLHANGVDLPNKLDGSNAASVVLHK